jgi:hypothetical protein
MGRPKKITAEVSSYIETLSSLDSTLTNFEIRKLIQSRWTSLKLSESSVSAERIKLGFIWRPPFVKQDLTVAQQHQRVQFASNLTALAIDPTKIIFSGESRQPPEPLDTSSLPEEEPLNSAEFFRRPPFAPDMPPDRLTLESVGIWTESG